jgi:hypothetical protein
LTEGSGAWGWIFRDGGDAASASIESLDIKDNRANLEIAMSRGLQISQAGAPATNGKPGAYEPVITTSGRPLHSLVLDFSDSQGRSGRSRIRMDGAAPTVEYDGGGFSFRRWYLATKAESPVETAQIYSRVVLADREEAVIETLRVVDPRLKRLRVLDTGTGPSIHADFGEGKFLPASVAGRGFGRILTLACVLVDNAGGLVLVDEIEDGLHYSVLPNVWRAVIDLAEKSSVQIFATTHSYECVEAALGASGDSEDKLVLYRLSRRDGDIRATRVGLESMRAAADFALELR